MKSRASFLIAIGALFAPLHAQEKSAPASQDAMPAAANSLARALAAFEALDADHDGRVDAREGERIDGLRAGEFSAEDADGDGRLCRGEFLVLYRQLLSRSGLRAAPDLEQETARVQALRRARAALSDRRWEAGGDPALRALVARSTPRVPATEGRLLDAFGELERSVLSGQASPSKFTSLRDAWRATQRDAAAAAAAGQRSRAPSADVERALAELEAEVKSGGARTVVRLRALRELLTGSPRESSAKPMVSNPPPSTPAPAALRIVRIDSALEDLQRALDARTASAADIERVRGLASAACRQAGRTDAAACFELERLFGELELRRAQSGDTREAFVALRTHVLATLAQSDANTTARSQPVAPGSTRESPAPPPRR